jgi:hypothetical protein
MSLFEIAKKRFIPPTDGILSGEEDRMRRAAHLSTLRMIARLPIEHRKRAAKKTYEGLEENMVLKFLESIRQFDPLCVDRDSEKGDLIIRRTGANWEASVLLAALYRATPLSSLNFRTNEYASQAEKDFGESKLAKSLTKIKIFQSPDPLFSAFVREHGGTENFRRMMRDYIVHEKNLGNGIIDRGIGDLEEESQVLAEVFASKAGMGVEDLIKTTDIRLLRNKSGFLTDSATEYIDKYDSQLKNRIPKFCVAVSPTETAALPF